MTSRATSTGVFRNGASCHEQFGIVDGKCRAARIQPGLFLHQQVRTIPDRNITTETAAVVRQVPLATLHHVCTKSLIYRLAPALEPNNVPRLARSTRRHR